MNEEDLLKQIKFVLSCGNDAQAVRLIEKYGHCRHEEALQLHKTQVSGSVCLDTELQILLGDLIYQEENCFDWTDKKKIKNKINAVSILLGISTVREHYR